MKRNLKNILMILIIIVIGVCSYFTMKDVQGSDQNNFEKENQIMQEGQSGSKDPMQGNENDNMGNKPTQGNSEANGDTKETPPEKPNGDSSPEQQPGKNDNNEFKEMPSIKAPNISNSGIRTIHYIMFGIEGCIISILIIYLIMSKFNKLTLRETLNETQKIIIFILLLILVTSLLTIVQVYITNNLFVVKNIENQPMFPGANMNSLSTSSVTKTGATEIDGTEETLTDNYTTSESDESVILVKNGGNVTVDGAEITKAGGDSSNTENSEFYGVNAGILVTEDSTATIKNATISTNAKGSNAVFSTGTNSKIYISNSTINTTGSSSSRGLDATYGGYIEADNVNITTQGGSSAALATDRGEGTVIAKNSKLETNGSGSPVIYSTGNISITNIEGTANGSQMVVIEGKNSATVTNSILTASGKGNRGDTDQAGIMIYQSMSGDAGIGKGEFTAEGSSLTIKADSKYYETAPMFFITNTDATINLNNCKLSYGSNILISSKGTSEWGNSGSNGGNVTLNAENQTLTGNIEIDNISTLSMDLSNSSYTGTINNDNTAKEITLKLDTNSSITLTGDSYVTSLEDSDGSYSNINFNGYKLYVNGNAIN